jgi:hypothetical protein
VPFDDAVTNVYVVLLLISGILLLVMAGLGLGATNAARAINGIIGAAMLGYAIYLLFFFTNGTVRIFFYVFVVPIYAIVNFVRNRKVEQPAARTGPTPPAA